MAALSNLPEVCLLNVIKFLRLTDICNLMKLDDRIRGICCERSVARTITIEGNYLLGEEDILEYIKAAGHHVEKLQLNHCHWLSPKLLNTAIQTCRNVTHLDLIECRLKTSALVHHLARMSHLISLSFSIVSFSDIKKDVFTAATNTLKNLQCLHVYFTSRDLSIMVYLGEHTTMIDYCTSLEELRIGSAGMAIPELYRPIISNPSNHLQLKVMCITNNIHAGAQMMFYGTLSQLPNSQLQWRTLLMPNVNLEEFTKKLEFRDCLKNIKSLKSLDVSGSKVNFPNPAVDLSVACGLQHLCLASTNVCSRDLTQIGAQCPNLTTLNLQHCAEIFKNESHNPDSSGLASLLSRCRKLQHLNLSGEHHHCLPSFTFQQLANSLSGLKSLSLPTCMLSDDATADRKPGKRIASTRGYGMAPPKRVCLEQSRSSSPSPSTSSAAAAAAAADASPSSDSTANLLERIVENNPGLEQLEIIAADFNSVIQKNKFINARTLKFLPCPESRRLRDVGIRPISRLEYLRSLTLCGLPGLASGASLAAILRGCWRLESLTLSMLRGGMTGNTFTKELPNCPSLQDIRLEQPFLPLNGMFFDALSQCSQLQRLCILAKESNFNRDHVLKMVEKCEKLAVLQIYAGGTITASKTLTNTLKSKYCRSGKRPGAAFTICPLMADILPEAATSVPAKHLDELGRFYSRVAAYPPGYKL